MLCSTACSVPIFLVLMFSLAEHIVFGQLQFACLAYPSYLVSPRKKENRKKKKKRKKKKTDLFCEAPDERISGRCSVNVSSVYLQMGKVRVMRAKNLSNSIASGPLYMVFNL